MARTRSSRSKTPVKKKRTPTKKKTPAKKSDAKKAASKNGSSAAGFGPTADQMLLVNTFCQGFYGFAFFGFGEPHHDKFFGKDAVAKYGEAGPLCTAMPTWMGVMNMLFCANNVATYLRGSEKDKLSHLFVLSIHWFMWFVCMCFAGCQDINNGAFVAKEYYMGVFITFVMSYLNRKVAGSFTLAPTGIKFDTTVDRAFLVSFVIALFNVFNVFVMGGKEWFQVKSEVPNPHCVLDVKFFGSMILATAMSTMVVGNGASDAMKKAFLQNGLIIQAVFLYLTYQIRDSSGNMVYVQYALSLIQAAACYLAQEEL